MGYCHINTDDGRFYDDIGKNECFCLIDAVVNPATKKQRDLLFQKMKETGYEWDEEKKELGKIEKQSEQKPTLRERYENIAKSEWFKKTHEGMSVSNDEEPKWSEEDNKRIDQICDDLECGMINMNAGKTIRGLHFDSIIRSNIEWLKSLKERMK